MIGRCQGADLDSDSGLEETLKTHYQHYIGISFVSLLPNPEKPHTFV